MKPDEVLDAAADDILINGHYKGDFYENPNDVNSSACALGALGRVSGFNVLEPSCWNDEERGAYGAYATAREALVDHLGSGVVSWNDDPERTAGDVMDTLRTVAKELRDS